LNFNGLERQFFRKEQEGFHGSASLKLSRRTCFSGKAEKGFVWKIQVIRAMMGSASSTHPTLKIEAAIDIIVSRFSEKDRRKSQQSIAHRL
jgi:hypothetical protein